MVLNKYPPPRGEEANERKIFSTTTHRPESLERLEATRAMEEQERPPRRPGTPPATLNPLEHCASRAAQGAAIAQR